MVKKIKSDLPETINNIEQPAIEQKSETLSPWLEQWMEDMNAHVNRMNNDEEYRKRVAKYLS